MNNRYKINLTCIDIYPNFRVEYPSTFDFENDFEQFNSNFKSSIYSFVKFYFRDNLSIISITKNKNIITIWYDNGNKTKCLVTCNDIIDLDFCYDNFITWIFYYNYKHDKGLIINKLDIISKLGGISKC